MLYKVYQPIPQYNGQLQLEFTATLEGLKELIKNKIPKKECTCCKRIINTGKPIQDFERMGFVVRAVEQNYIRN